MSQQNEHESTTPYDDVFRTLIVKGGNLIIPFLNEMFREDPPIRMDVSIAPAANEHFLDLGQGRQVKLTTDSILVIDQNPYHIECQSYEDKTMLLRTCQYDWLSAMPGSLVEGDTIHIPLPYSGILYLRRTTQTPETMFVHYHHPQGGELRYPVRTLSLRNYTLEDMISKHLFFLMPFYLFNFEEELKHYDENKAAREDVIHSLDRLLGYLNQMFSKGYLNIYQYGLITDMLRKVTDSLTQKYKSARKELDEIMGGKILEFKGEREYNEGKEKGRQEGRQEGRIEGRQEGRIEGRQEGRIELLVNLVNAGQLNDAFAIKQAQKFGISEENFKKMLTSYDPGDERLQG